MENKPYLIALNHLAHVGPRTIKKLLARWPSLKDMFALNHHQLCQAGLPERLAQSIAGFDFHHVESDWRWMQQDNHFILTWADPDYPFLLNQVDDPPPVLYGKGQKVCLRRPLLAMVGTRKPSVTGEETAWRLAYELAQSGVVIVSGLALGIDAKAHRGALDADAATVAVLGSGVERIYPAHHRALARSIEQQGVLLSEFPLYSPPKAGHFPRRNRIISGLSLATLVVEAAKMSGSLITARFALEQNRNVFAVPGSIYNVQAQGCLQLIQEGATLVTASNDVLAELGMMSVPLESVGSKERLASEDEDLVKCIGFECTPMDRILARCAISMDVLGCKLAELELDGWIKSIPGGYMRCK